MMTLRTIANFSLAIMCLAGCALLVVGLAARLAVVAAIELGVLFFVETKKHFGLLVILLLAGCAQPVVKKSFTTAPTLPPVESVAQGSAVAPGQPVTLAWDSSNTEFRIYTSLDKVQWVRGMTVHTNVAVVNANLPQWFRVTAVEGSLESFPSNKLLVVGKTNGIVVTGEHAATPDGPWQSYAVPVFSGSASGDMQVFRVKAQTQSGWQTVSEP